MSRCLLGSKKVKKIEAFLGAKVKSASVRGGNAHFWATVYVEGEDKSLLVNYKTGVVVRDIDAANQAVQAAFDAAWNSGESETDAKRAMANKHFEIFGEYP